MRVAAFLFTLGAAAMTSGLAGPGTAPVQVASAVAEEPAPKFLTGKARKDFLVEVAKKMGDLRSVAATFEQEKRLALFKEPLRSSGQVLFTAPDHLRWEFTEPFMSVLIVSGDQVAKFERLELGWRKLEQGRQAQVILVVMDHIRSWFRGQFDAGGDGFDVQVAREPRAMIRLRPREEVLARNLQEVELVLAKGNSHVERVTIREAGGNSTVMDFTQLKRKPSSPLPKRYFSLEQVIEVGPKELEQKVETEIPDKGADEGVGPK
jgi:hypothetical protein